MGRLSQEGRTPEDKRLDRHRHQRSLCGVHLFGDQRADTLVFDGGWPMLLILRARATQWVPRPSCSLRRAGTTNYWRFKSSLPDQSFFRVFLDSTNKNLLIPSASCPPFAKNAKNGTPIEENGLGSQRLGHPPPAVPDFCGGLTHFSQRTREMGHLRSGLRPKT